MVVIESIQFSLLSPEEIKAYAVCEVNNTQLKGNDANTLSDKRMGVNSNKEKCLTCSQNNVNCPGHFGFINLAEPVIHPKFVRIIYAILKCICFECSCSLISEEFAKLHNLLKYKRDRRLKIFIEHCKKIKTCRVESCGAPVPNYRIKDNEIFYYYDKKNIMELETQLLYNILRKISNEDFQLLGFNYELGTNPSFTSPEYLLDVDMVHRHQTRPEWMILTALPVLPPCARPSIQDENERLDDHFIDLYTRILKNNNKLLDSKNSHGIVVQKSATVKTRGRKKLGALTEKERKEVSIELKKCVKALIDNRDGKLKLPNGQPHKGITERLTSKEGLVRKNIQGKRSDFTARTVAGGDPTLAIDEIIVPEQIAKKITYPEKVCDFNKEWLLKLINEKKANYIIRKNKRTGETTTFFLANAKNVSFDNMDIYEYTVERHMMDGDPFIINRQPTLRIESMLGARARIMPGKTFRTNLSISTPMNMDIF